MHSAFSTLYGRLGDMVSDAGSGSLTLRKHHINMAYRELARVRGWWRRRSYTYSASSSIPLPRSNSTMRGAD